jgi:hypothetical protein
LAYTNHVERSPHFIGFANFYCWFIQDFATLARPLHDLTKKDVPWQWHLEQQQAFDALKQNSVRNPSSKSMIQNFPLVWKSMLLDSLPAAYSLKREKTAYGTPSLIAQTL